MTTTDSALQTLVLAELAWEPAVTAAHIGVTARDGVVTLTGHVGHLRTWDERGAADSAAWSAPGVTDVENQLIIA